MDKNKKNNEIHIKWNWKTFWIIILIILLAIVSYSYRNYQQEAQNTIYELELNLTKEYANFDCYERGTVDCYEKGSIGNVEDKLEEFLRTNDCYERGSVYCYNEPRTLYTCDGGYELGCVLK